MKRREFISGAAAASPLAFSLPSRASSQTRTVGEATHTLADLPLGGLRDIYRRDLMEDFLPFMERYVIDDTYGGFMCNTDYTGQRVNDAKMSWFEGRGIWVYAFLYNNISRDKKHLEVARRSLEFVMRVRPQGPDQLWPKEMSREGNPLTSAEGEIYGDLFIAEGLAEYSKATSREEYWQTAKELVLKCMRLYDREDYRPTIGQTYLGSEARLFPGARIQGVWMVMLRVATQMLRMRSDAAIESIARRSAEAVLKHHYNPRLRLNNELLSHDLSRPANEYSQLVYTGHAIETLWMLLDEAVRLKDREMFETVAERFKRHVEVAWDDLYGGVFRNLMNADGNVWTLDKVLWAQEEVLIGSLIIVEHTGADWARKMFSEVFHYVQTTFPLRKYGSPLWMYAGNRRVEFEEFKTRPKRVENFHHPRHLMLNLLALEQMIKRGGSISTHFS